MRAVTTFHEIGFSPTALETALDAHLLRTLDGGELVERDVAVGISGAFVFPDVDAVLADFPEHDVAAMVPWAEVVGVLGRRLVRRIQNRPRTSTVSAGVDS